MIRKFLFIAPLFLAPFISFADTPTDLQSLVSIFTGIILGSIVPLISSLAMIMFLWGIAKFISNSGDAKTHQDGKMMMIWGVVGLFVMVSYIAIIRATHNDFGFTTSFGQPRIIINSQ